MRLLGPLALLAWCTAACPDDSAWRLDSAGLLDLRVAAGDDETSWLDGGFGKARYGATRDEPVAHIPEASLLLMPHYGWDWSGHVHLKADTDQDRLLGLVEGFVTWKPVSITPDRYFLRSGIFYPPISLENTGLAWTSPYTLTPSAINAWVGEETRGYGAEAGWAHRSDENTITLSSAALWGTDKAGTVLYRRGWALHDYKPAIADRLPVPVPQGATYLSGYSSSMLEIDERPGYYLALDWDDIDGRQARVLYYDNRTDPTSVEDGESGWLTKFTAAGLRWPLGKNTELIAQYLGGYTLLEVPGRYTVRTDFDAAFLLLTHTRGRFRLSGRVDWFEVEDVDGVSLDFSEDGHALTLAGRYDTGRHRSLWLELLGIDARRPTRATPATGSRWHEYTVQLGYRFEFR